jgi:hypothetical protein
MSNNNEVDFEWNLYHDMETRSYHDINRIKELETENEKLQSKFNKLAIEFELRHRWVKHHQRCTELNSEREHVLEKKLASYEVRAKELEILAVLAVEREAEMLKRIALYEFRIKELEEQFLELSNEDLHNREGRIVSDAGISLCRLD